MAAKAGDPIKQVPQSESINQMSQEEIEYTNGVKVLHNCTFPKYFVEGLALSNDGRLFVSSGQYGRSALATLAYDIDSCQFNEIFKKPLNFSIFGEGIAIVDNKLYQLQYKSQNVTVFNLVQNQLDFSLDGEYTNNAMIEGGWGLASTSSGGKQLLYGTNGSELIVEFEASGMN